MIPKATIFVNFVKGRQFVFNLKDFGVNMNYKNTVTTYSYLNSALIIFSNLLSS